MRLRQYLLYLNRSKVVTHTCAFWEKTSTDSFQRKTNTSWCASLYFRSIQKEISLSKNFYIRFLCGKWKALICSSLLLSPLPRSTPDRWGSGLCSAVFNSEWERSKYHILENIAFTYFQHKMHNKADCPATNHSVNMQTSPTAKPHKRPKCAGTSAGSSIPGGGMRETPLPGSVTQIRTPALIQHWSALVRVMVAFCWKGANLAPGVRMGDGYGRGDRLPL